MPDKGSYQTVGSPDDVKWVDPTGQYQAGLDSFTNEANAMKALMAGYSGQASDAYGRMSAPIDAMGSSLAQMNDATGRASGYGASADAYARQGAGALGRTQGYMDRAMAYDPNAYMRQFMGQQGDLAYIAQGASAPLGASLNAIAARNAALGGEAALAAMPGGRRSGAGMAAFSDAYASPFAQAAAQTQAAQLGLTGQLWGQAMGSNAEAQRYQAALAGEMAGRSIDLGSGYDALSRGQLGIGSMYLDQANSYGAQAGLYGSQASLYGDQGAGYSGLSAQYGDLYGQNQGYRQALLANMGELWSPTYEYTTDRPSRDPSLSYRPPAADPTDPNAADADDYHRRGSSDPDAARRPSSRRYSGFSAFM